MLCFFSFSSCQGDYVVNVVFFIAVVPRPSVILGYDVVCPLCQWFLWYSFTAVIPRPSVIYSMMNIVCPFCQYLLWCIFTAVVLRPSVIYSMVQYVHSVIGCYGAFLQQLLQTIAFIIFSEKQEMLTRFDVHFFFSFFCYYLNLSSYYSLEDTEHNSVNTFLSQLVEKSVVDLGYAYCLEIGEVSFKAKGV